MLNKFFGMSQESTHPSPLPLPGGEVRRNGEFRGVSRIFYSLIFLQLFCLLS
ncbi:hypothetical protein [Okeania sp. SIO2C2]|uniref:hypothetical protein n=1 Tax=Okeania sp. SIO2C2 TaxID=2607787 RepID=UPI00257BADF0|nr:hypothetical protein [Okeania sp. SIO2C2]